MLSVLSRRSVASIATPGYLRACAAAAAPATVGTTTQPSFVRRDIHGTPLKPQADATAAVTSSSSASSSKSSASASALSNGLVNRFVTGAEVTVSKIFPAGFGWQTASVVASEQFGYASDSAAFALTTGVGDAIGVLGGHVGYYALKKSVVADDEASIDLNKELQTGILLGSAAFCSGTAWQPIVDVLQGANMSFGQVFCGTWIGCGSAFYVGLRAGRSILSGFMQHVEEPTYDNSKNDASLSVAIGGATGFFVGTDTAYLPEQNFLINVVGINDGTPDLAASAIAGTSTAMGFATVQTGLNVAYPAGKLWND